MAKEGREEMNDDRYWEVVGAINGNCVYVKRDITQIQAQHFIDCIEVYDDGTCVYHWPDGEAIRVLGASCAFWMRRSTRD